MASINFTAASEADLNADINVIDTDGINSYTIDIAGNLTLTSNIAAIAAAAGATVTIDDQGGTINGAGFEGFTVNSGTVTLQNMTIEGAVAQGGAGGAGAGGGAGLGGAVFVGAGGNVTLANVVLNQNAAKGGAGGANASPDGGAGGGLNGGGGGAPGATGAPGSFGGGGGSGYVASGVGISGGAGGFGGGGGGGGTYEVTNPNISFPVEAAGVGGFGAGAGGAGSLFIVGGGGGGLGAGGAVFVETGGQLTIGSGTISGNSVTGGAGGTGGFGGGSGEGLGSGLFLQSGAATFDPASGVTLPILDNIADDNGAASLAMTGAGTLSLGGTNTFGGGLTIESGAVVLGGTSAAGTGTITFAGPGTELTLLGFAALTNDLAGFTAGDTLNLPDEFFNTSPAASLAAGSLTIDDSSLGNESFKISDPKALGLVLSADPAGGTALVASDTVTVDSESQLNAAIGLLNSDSAGAYTIEISGSLTLTSAIAPISAASGTTLLIDDQGGTINGAGFEGFTVNSGTVTLQNMTIEGAVAQGGAGGAGAGGGAGLGGAVFVGAGGNVTLANVVLNQNAAKGGAGGASANEYGGVGGGLNGGGGGAPASTGATGSFGGGGGSAFVANGAGVPSGAGGFGGGGGGGGTYEVNNPIASFPVEAAGVGGFGAGAGGAGSLFYVGGGGGGLGAGGAVFVQSGGQLTIGGGTLTGNTVAGGAASGGGGAGSAYGHDIFMQSGTMTLDPGAGTSLVFGDGIADETESNAADAGFSTGLLMTGAGTVELDGVESFSGGIAILSGLVQIDASASAFGGTIDFAGAGAALAVMGTAPVGNRLVAFGSGNTLELPNVAPAGVAAAFSGSTLVVHAASPETFEVSGATVFGLATATLPFGGLALVASDTATVSTGAELATAIGLLNSQPAGNYTIDLATSVTLSAGLPTIDPASGVDLTVVGNNHSIDGNGFEGFSVASGVVTLQNLTVYGASAVGGSGGLAGGGGAGLGGALFVGSGGQATLDSVTLTDDSATGGQGGGPQAYLGGNGGALNAGTLAGTGAALTSGGGFGGGGGSGEAILSTAVLGGAGGFGGGGGGGGDAFDEKSTITPGGAGAGGFGGGDGAGNQGLFNEVYGGGGGLGAGGAVFVQSGGGLTIGSGALSGNSVAGGAPGKGAGAGSAYGADLFLQSGTATLDPAAGTTLSLADGIADVAGSNTNYAGTANLLMTGAGEVALSGVNSFTGGITIDSGTVSLASAASAGSGSIDFAGPGTTLAFANAPGSVANTLSGFAVGDAIDLSSVPFGSGGAATFNGSTIDFASTRGSATLDLTGNSAIGIETTQDAAGNTELVGTNIATVSNEAELNAAIASIDAIVASNYLPETIDLASSFTLTSDIAPLDPAAHAVVSIIGAGNTISGAGFQGFAVQSGELLLENLTISGAVARGGSPGSLNGGGGAGLGGALFVGSNALAELVNANLLNDGAIGGSGAPGGVNQGGGSGGGLNGGAVSSQGGGFGEGGSGGASGVPGGAGGFGGGGGGGFSGSSAGLGGFGAGIGGASSNNVAGGGGGGLGAGGAVFVQAGGILEFQGGTLSGDSATGGQNGGGSAGIGLGLGGSIFMQSGAIDVDAGAGQTLDIADAIADEQGSQPGFAGNSTSVLMANDGTLVLSGTNTFTGGVTLDGGTVQLGNASAAGSGTIDFNAGAFADLAISGSAMPANAIEGFSTGDTIDLSNIGFAGKASATINAGGTLAVVEGGITADLAFAPKFAAGSVFALSSDGASGTDIAAPCFVQGTQIATERGAASVEALAVGARVPAASGTVRTVVWLGHRTVDCRRHPRPLDVWPVRVAAQAFGPGSPARDLWLSPDHAVFVEGVLIPVRYLVNGRTVVQEPRDTVTYWHVELDRHDVLLAEGLPCESYLDTGNRAAFANGGGAVQMQPDFALKVWQAQACAPLVLGGAALAAARTRLLAQAGRLGHRLTDRPDLTVLADGRALKPLGSGALWRLRLPEGTQRLRLVSRVWFAAHTRPAETDLRPLGIAVARLRLDRQPLGLTSPALTTGWHAPETLLRWTDGDAAIEVAGARELAFEVAMTGSYWRTEKPGRTQAA